MICLHRSRLPLPGSRSILQGGRRTRLCLFRWSRKSLGTFEQPEGLQIIMDENKMARKGESRLEEVRRKEQEEKREVEKKKKEERLKELCKKSSPLVDYGLLDAYQFFLSQLAASGMPQANVFEFAAQSMLKFQKGKVKRDETLREVQRVNEQASKVVMQPNRSRSKPKFQRQIKPQLMPFKGNLSRQEMDLMGIK